MFDVVITGGTVVDGSGKPGYAADVGIRGERIEAVGLVRRIVDPAVIARVTVVVENDFLIEVAQLNHDAKSSWARPKAATRTSTSAFVL